MKTSVSAILAPMTPAVVAVYVPVPVPPLPLSPARGSSQDAHVSRPFLLYDEQVVHFHLFVKCLATAEPPHPNADPAPTGTYRTLQLLHWLYMSSFDVSHLVQFHRSPCTASSARPLLVRGPVFSLLPSTKLYRALYA
jgi:hypothetical protein